MAFLIKCKCGPINKYLVHVPIIDCYLEFDNLGIAKDMIGVIKKMI